MCVIRDGSRFVPLWSDERSTLPNKCVLGVGFLGQGESQNLVDEYPNAGDCWLMEPKVEKRSVKRLHPRTVEGMLWTRSIGWQHTGRFPQRDVLGWGRGQGCIRALDQALGSVQP